MPKRNENPGAANREPRRKKGGPASISKDRRRRIYLTHRLPDILSALKDLANETETLSVRLEDTALARGSSERRKAEERLIYLRERRPALMKELEALKKEHAKLAKQ